MIIKAAVFSAAWPLGSNIQPCTIFLFSHCYERKLCVFPINIHFCSYSVSFTASKVTGLTGREQSSKIQYSVHSEISSWTVRIHDICTWGKLGIFRITRSGFWCDMSSIKNKPTDSRIFSTSFSLKVLGVPGMEQNTSDKSESVLFLT